MWAKLYTCVLCSIYHGFLFYSCWWIYSNMVLKWTIVQLEKYVMNLFVYWWLFVINWTRVNILSSNLPNIWPFNIWFLCPARYDRGDIMIPGCPSVCPAIHPAFCLSVHPFVSSHFRGTTLHAAPTKRYAFTANYHACMAMPTWCRCAHPTLCWHSPPYNLFPRSCLASHFFVDPHWWVPFCV